MLTLWLSDDWDTSLYFHETLSYKNKAQIQPLFYDLDTLCVKKKAKQVEAELCLAQHSLG